MNNSSKLHYFRLLKKFLLVFTLFGLSINRGEAGEFNMNTDITPEIRNGPFYMFLFHANPIERGIEPMFYGEMQTYYPGSTNAVASARVLSRSPYWNLQANLLAIQEHLGNNNPIVLGAGPPELPQNIFSRPSPGYTPIQGAKSVYWMEAEVARRMGAEFAYPIPGLSSLDPNTKIPNTPEWIDVYRVPLNPCAKPFPDIARGSAGELARQLAQRGSGGRLGAATSTGGSALGLAGTALNVYNAGSTGASVQKSIDSGREPSFTGSSMLDNVLTSIWTFYTPSVGTMRGIYDAKNAALELEEREARENNLPARSYVPSLSAP